jgi:hypothetical protein
VSGRPPDVIERVVHVTLFGIGLWDSATHELRTDRLAMSVRARNAAGFGAPLQAVAGRAGIFFVNRLPGLRRYELPEDDSDLWQEPPSPLSALPFLVEVRDGREWFTPFVLQVSLPSPERGPVVPDCLGQLVPAASLPASPPAAAPAFVPLFSGPGRPVPAGMAAIRATLLDGLTGLPAAYAVLEVHRAGRLAARGIADERGAVLALMGWPEPTSPPPPAASPPASPPSSTSESAPAASVPLNRQEWPLEITVRWDRALRRYSPDPRRGGLPDLCEVLQQPVAALETSSPPAPLDAATLRYGSELVLGADTGASAELFIISPA